MEWIFMELNYGWKLLIFRWDININSFISNFGHTRLQLPVAERNS